MVFCHLFFMSYTNYHKRINQIHSLIQRGSTGSRGVLATRLGVSISTLHNTINYMRNTLDAPIKYNVTLKTYYYTTDWQMNLMFKPAKEIDRAMELLQMMEQLEIDMASFLQILSIIKQIGEKFISKEGQYLHIDRDSGNVGTP